MPNYNMPPERVWVDVYDGESGYDPCGSDWVEGEKPEEEEFTNWVEYIRVSPSPTPAEVKEQAAKIAELWEDEKHVNPARAIARAIRELKVVAPSPTNKDSETEDSGEMKTSPLSPNLKVS